VVTGFLWTVLGVPHLPWRPTTATAVLIAIIVEIVLLRVMQSGRAVRQVPLAKAWGQKRKRERNLPLVGVILLIATEIAPLLQERK